MLAFNDLVLIWTSAMNSITLPQCHHLSKDNESRVQLVVEREHRLALVATWQLRLHADETEVRFRRHILKAECVGMNL